MNVFRRGRVWQTIGNATKRRVCLVVDAERGPKRARSEKVVIRAAPAAPRRAPPDTGRPGPHRGIIAVGPCRARMATTGTNVTARAGETGRSPRDTIPFRVAQSRFPSDRVPTGKTAAGPHVFTREHSIMNRTTNRRGLLQSVATGLALNLSSAAEASAQTADSQPILRSGDRVDVAGREAKIIETAFRLGHEYEQRHGGCAQCVLAALQDALPELKADVGVFRAASCVDGGATPSGIQSCGAFTGAGLFFGFLCGRSRDETFFGDKRLSQELMRKVYAQFERHYGSVLCKDVRAVAKSDCPQVVGLAAQWAAEALLETFADYRPPADPADPAGRPTPDDGTSEPPH